MSSTPIAIPSNRNKEAQSLSTSFASSLSSSRLYIPLHRRRTSMSRTDDSFSSSSSSVSSRLLSRAESHIESEPEHNHYYDPTHIYSRESLLALAKSPLALMPKEVKDGLRETVPEIVMSRKHRKAMEYRARTQQQQQQQQIISHQKEISASPEDMPRGHRHQEPQNRELQRLQDYPVDLAQQQLERSRRHQVLLHQPQLQYQQQKHAVVLPRANQQKRWITTSSTSTNTRSRDADVNWRRTARPPSATISAA